MTPNKKGGLAYEGEMNERGRWKERGGDNGCRHGQTTMKARGEDHIDDKLITPPLMDH